MDILYYTQATAGDGRGGWVSGVDGALKVESFPRRRRWSGRHAQGGRELMLNTCEPLSHIGLAVGLSDRAAGRACSASTWASVLSSGPLVAGGRGNRAALSRRPVPLLDRLFGLSSPA